MKNYISAFIFLFVFIGASFAQEVSPTIEVVSKKWKFGLHFDSLNETQKAFNGISKGVIINKVSKDHPAEAANMMVGDILTHVSGIEVIDQAHCVELMKNLDISSGVSVLNIIRNGVKMEVPVKFDQK